MTDVACRAASWYNEATNLLCSEETAATILRTLIHLYRRCIVDTIPQDNTPRKQCTGPCGQFLPATTEFFCRKASAKDGLYTRCKECKSKTDSEYRNRPEVHERKLASDTVYRNHPDNQEQIKAYRRLPQVREKNRTYLKSRYEQDSEFREQTLAQNRAYQQRPEYKEQRRTKYHTVPEYHDQVHIQGLTRLARKKSVAGTYTVDQIRAQLKRQKHRCYYCATKLEKRHGHYVYHIDHTFPLSRVAGTDIPGNDISYLVLTCPTCNLKKGNKFPWEFPEGGKLL